MKKKILLLISCCALSLEILASAQNPEFIVATSKTVITNPNTGEVTTTIKDGNKTTVTVVDSKGNTSVRSTTKATKEMEEAIDALFLPNSQAGLKYARLGFEKIVQEYKDYLAKIPVETRQEIVAYRREISRLNQEKISLYDKLSQRAQEYLKKERDFKQRLPIQNPVLPISSSAMPVSAKPSDNN